MPIVYLIQLCNRAVKYCDD